MKKIWKGLLKSCFIVVFTVLVLISYSKYLDIEISKLYAEKSDGLSLINGIAEKDKGNAWIRESGENGDLFVLGSSELASPVQQNIKNNFPNEDYAHNISAIGHSDVQNSLHAMDIGANYENMKENDIVIIESIQWFFGDEIGADGFMSNFSELQFYEFLHNDKISESNKAYLCNRFLELESKRVIEAKASHPQDHNLLGRLWYKALESGMTRLVVANYDYPQTHMLAKLYISDNLWDKVVYQIMRPYYYVKYEIMKLKDKRDVYNYLKAMDTVEQKTVFSTNWTAQLQQAETDGEQACTNNDIYVYDDYYIQYLSQEWENLENSIKDIKTLESKEWEDFRFLLSVCNDLELHPYIVNVSANGYYYDHVGVNNESRQEYYSKLEEVADEYGIETYNDLKNMEYVPYTFADVMHLGWKGWIYVTEAITEHFSK